MLKKIFVSIINFLGRKNIEDRKYHLYKTKYGYSNKVAREKAREQAEWGIK